MWFPRERNIENTAIKLSGGRVIVNGRSRGIARLSVCTVIALLAYSRNNRLRNQIFFGLDRFFSSFSLSFFSPSTAIKIEDEINHDVNSRRRNCTTKESQED